MTDVDKGSEFWALPQLEYAKIMDRIVVMSSDDCNLTVPLILSEFQALGECLRPMRRLCRRKSANGPTRLPKSPTTTTVCSPMSAVTYSARLQPFEDDLRARLFSVVRRGNIMAAYRVKLHLAGICETAFATAFSNFRDVTDRSSGTWRSTLAEALAGKGKFQSTRVAFFDEDVLRDWCSFNLVDPSKGCGAAVLLVTSRKVLIELHCSLRVNMRRKLGSQFMGVLRATTGVWGSDGSLQWSPTCDNVKDYVDRKPALIHCLRHLFPPSAAQPLPNISFDPITLNSDIDEIVDLNCL